MIEVIFHVHAYIGFAIELMYFLVDKGFNSSNLLPGTGMSSLMETIKLTSCASSLQMAGALIVPSFYYNNPTDQGGIDYYSKIVVLFTVFLFCSIID